MLKFTYQALFAFYLEHNRIQKENTLMYLLLIDRFKGWMNANTIQINRMLEKRSEIFEKYCVLNKSTNLYETIVLDNKTVMKMKVDGTRKEFDALFQQWENTAVNINFEKPSGNPSPDRSKILLPR